MSATNPATALILDLLGELKREQSTPDFYIAEYHRLQKENSNLSDTIKDISIELGNLRTLCAESEDAYRTQEAYSIDTITGLKNEVSALRQQRDELKRHVSDLKFTIGELLK